MSLKTQHLLRDVSAHCSHTRNNVPEVDQQCQDLVKKEEHVLDRARPTCGPPTTRCKLGFRIRDRWVPAESSRGPPLGSRPRRERPPGHHHLRSAHQESGCQPQAPQDVENIAMSSFSVRAVTSPLTRTATPRKFRCARGSRERKCLEQLAQHQRQCP